MKDALLKTIAGRVILGGLVIRVADFVLELMLGSLPFSLVVVDTIATLAVAGGGAYFLARGLAFMNRRLLWRVRRKLVISYIFIGFIPTILAVLFFALGGVLLFFNFGGYMVRSEFRLAVERVRSVAHTTAVDIQRGGGRDAVGVLRRTEQNFAEEFPGLALAVVPASRVCTAEEQPATRLVGRSDFPNATAGSWSHVDPPADIPAWIGCDGFGGLLLSAPANWRGATDDLGVVIRAVAFPESVSAGYAVVVDVSVSPELKRRLRQDIGVEVENVAQVSETQVSETERKLDVQPLPGKAARSALLEPTGLPRPSLTSIAFLEVRDWSGGTGSLTLGVRLSISEMYQRISAAPGQQNNMVIVILEFVGGLFLVLEVVALLTGLALAKSITGSVHELFEGTERVRQGDFVHKIAVMGNDQLANLAQSFNSMTSSIEDLLLEAAEKKRLEEELRIAHEIQMSLLPQGPLTMEGLSVTAVCVPAREVGGDYYDFLRLDEHRLGVLIADVSGKGTSAALYMAEFKGLMLSLSRIHTSPRELLIAADRIIAPHLDARSFITVTYAVVDLRARTITYARAGHTPLIYLPANGGRTRPAHILAPNGLVLGLKIDRGNIFERLLEEETIPLKAGDLYLFFTDGITEAMNPADDFFGEQRLGSLLEEYGDLPPEALRDRMLREISAFVDGAPQHDDMTMILLKIEDVVQAPPPGEGVAAREAVEAGAGVAHGVS